MLPAEEAASAQGQRPKTTRPTWGSAGSGRAGELPTLPAPRESLGNGAAWKHVGRSVGGGRGN